MTHRLLDDDAFLDAVADRVAARLAGRPRPTVEPPRTHLRVGAWVHLYPPDHCAGAEMMLHEILTGLQARGHEVSVVCDKTSVDTFDGVPVASGDHAAAALFDWADIIITHLDRTRDVIRRNRQRPHGARKPLVHLVHNDKQLKYHGVRPPDAQLVVFNSEWLKNAVTWRGHSIVIPPPVHPDRYHVDRSAFAQHITLINLSEAKGAPLFWALAEMMPDRKFLGVRGGYGEQIVPDPIPPNVTILSHTPDINAVYGLTRILLMPSAYESWGRVGIEAAASGIPTIAHPTPGLRESLGDAGIFAHREFPVAWLAAIEALDDPARYRHASDTALARSAELDPTAHLYTLTAALTDTVTRWQQRA
jgi:glycosyltransferase involved in cell wall biosynthesis